MDEINDDFADTDTVLVIGATIRLTRRRRMIRRVRLLVCRAGSVESAERDCL